MASIHKRPDSRFYIAAYTDSQGRQMKRSTKSMDKKAAWKIAMEFEAAAAGDMSVNQARSVITNLMEAQGKSLGGRRTLRDWVTAWTARRKAEVKPATWAFYDGTGTRWLKWLGPRADVAMDAVSIEDLIAYRNHMEAEVTAKTCNHALTFIRMVFLAADNEGVIDRNPARLLKPVRAEEDREGRQPFTREQISALLAAADDEWRSMILCGAYTGQRLADVATLRWERVNLTAGTISLRARKTSRLTSLPLAPALWDHLRVRTVDASGYLHPRSAGHVTRTDVSGRLSNQFADLLVATGIRVACDGVRKGRRRVKNSLSFHSLRHTATSWMKEAGIPLSVVMDFIGHSDAAMSQLYTHTGDDALRKAADALPTLIVNAIGEARADSATSPHDQTH